MMSDLPRLSSLPRLPIMQVSEPPSSSHAPELMPTSMVLGAVVSRVPRDRKFTAKVETQSQRHFIRFLTSEFII